MNPLDGIWAKSAPPGQPRGELLTEHLDATLTALNLLRHRTGRIAAVPERFWTWAALACLFHDAGKIPEGFQRMVGNPRPAQKWGLRHEIYSLGFVDHVLAHLDEEERQWVALGVLTHHRPLSGGARSIKKQKGSLRTPHAVTDTFGPVDEQAANALTAWLAQRCYAPVPKPVTTSDLSRATHRLLTTVLDHWAEESPDDEAGLHAVLLQGAVTLADHVASAHTTLLTDHPLDAEYPERLRKRLANQDTELFPHQKAAARTSGHLLLRAPTGAGKTEASLLWALTQLDQVRATTGGQPRLFYTLPYLASINAMADRLGKELDDPEQQSIGVTHSKAADYHLRRAVDDDHDETEPLEHAIRAVAKANASRLFRELVRVTTPYQLMRAALAGPAHSSTLIDSVNSVFVFDELHAYDTHRLGIILAMMGLWTRLGGRIGVVSATLPDALAELIENSLGEPLAEVVPDSGRTWPRRHRLHLDETHLTSVESIDTIAEQLAWGNSVLVVANNVADAQNIYDTLAPTARELYGDDGAILLHARFRAKDRGEIERRILERYGTRQDHRPGLVVATQVVEVSLDLDFDILHTSAAPLEALIQRFGRVNRLNGRDQPAPVTVHHPDYAARSKGGGEEYADKVYAAEPTRLGWDILARHDGEPLDERLFTDWLNEVYASPWGQQWRSDVERVRTEFTRRFLAFDPPFDDRSDLAAAFDQMFDGVEGVLAEDLEDYRAELNRGKAPQTRKAARLLASGYLIPLPDHARRLGRWDKQLGLIVIDADYTEEKGLGALHRDDRTGYVMGEVL